MFRQQAAKLSLAIADLNRPRARVKGVEGKEPPRTADADLIAGEGGSQLVGTALETDAVGDVSPDRAERANADSMERLNEAWFRRREPLGRQIEILLPLGFRESEVRHRAAYLSETHERSMGLGLEQARLREYESERAVDLSPVASERDEGYLSPARRPRAERATFS
jgi:hypothetical protein